MDLKLNKDIKNPTIITGFLDFGLVGTITTQYLKENLNTELIGRIETDKILPIATIHNEKLIYPLGIYHDKKTNIIIITSTTAIKGLEWELCEKIIDFAKKSEAKEIIALESFGAKTESDKTFYYSNQGDKKYEHLGLEKLKEGVVMGITGSLLLRDSDFPLTCFFRQAHSNFPDSKAAAKMVETIDKYLGLKIDYTPLIEQAEKLEKQLKEMIAKGKQEELRKNQDLDYMG